MKKSMAILMSLFLMAGVTGCSGKPGKKETLRRLEENYGGEEFEIDDVMVRSLDRDLEFSYWYEWEGTPIWPDIDIPLGGKYILKTDYDSAVHNYWLDEYCESIEQYDFSKVDYGEDWDEDCCPKMMYILIEDEGTSEDFEKVESLLTDLRDICKKEDKFHEPLSSYYQYAYVVYIWYMDIDAETYRSQTLRITSKTKDKDLELDKLKMGSETKADPRKQPLSNGNTKIYVNGDG